MDDGAIRSVQVNGVPATPLDPNYLAWEAVIDAKPAASARSPSGRLRWTVPGIPKLCPIASTFTGPDRQGTRGAVLEPIRAAQIGYSM